jgi:hypothetical protein
MVILDINRTLKTVVRQASPPVNAVKDQATLSSAAFM